MSYSPQITGTTFLVFSMTLLLMLSGLLAHADRVEPAEKMAKSFTQTPTTSKLPATGSRSNQKEKDDCAKRGTSPGQTYSWMPEYPMDRNSFWNGRPDTTWFPWVGRDGRGGVPGAGDTAVLNSDEAGQFNDFIYLDQNRTVGTLIMRGQRNLSSGLWATLRSTIGPFTLTVTDAFEWTEGRILDGALVETGTNSAVTITRGSLGDYGFSPGYLTINKCGTISGPFTIVRGSRLTVGENGKLTISDSSVLVDGENISASTVDILGTAIIGESGGIDVNNLGAINVSGTLDIESNGGVSSNCECVMTIGEGGSMVKSAGDGNSSIGLKIDNAGTISAGAGTLAFSNTFTQTGGATTLAGGNIRIDRSLDLRGGELTGSGVIEGTVINGGGTISPGTGVNPFGTLTITNCCTQTTTSPATQTTAGRLRIEIGGRTQFDQLRIGGNLNLNPLVNTNSPSTIDLNVLNGYQPHFNERFSVVTYAHHDGEFAVGHNDLGNGRSFTLEYHDDRLEIVANGSRDTSDSDGDGVLDSWDNCVAVTNSDQSDLDDDRTGNVCDPDDDNDGFTDADESLAGSDPLNRASTPERCDGVDNDLDHGIDEGFPNTDGVGEADCIDLDDDNDGQTDLDELACGSNPLDAESKAEDFDRDNQPDCVDLDDDNDCFPDSVDAFRLDNTQFLEPNTAEPTDGPDIVFSSNRDGNWEIYGMQEDGTQVVRLTTNQGSDTEPTLSPDKSKIAFTSTRDGNREIYWMLADGSQVTRLTSHPANDRNAAWAPDGKRIVFTRFSDFKRRIYSINIPDCNGETCPIPDATRLTTRTSDQPAWSPNGCKISFAGPDESGHHLIFSMDHNGANLRTLTSFRRFSFSYHPSWSPDGRRIAFGRITGGSRVYTMNSDDGSDVRVLPLPGSAFEPAWGINGRIAFRSNQEIYSARASDGSGLRRFTSNTASDRWPDW